jgi:predicted nucleic acid-binding protein
MELGKTLRQPAAVVDASFVIGYCAKENNKYAQAKAKLEQYLNDGWQLFAPGVMVGEVLYALCRKVQEATLTAAEHAVAVGNFELLMNEIYPPPQGDSSLVARAESIRHPFGCARTNDSIYLALAEQLQDDRHAEVVTFDDGFQNHARANASTVRVEILPMP